MVSVFPQTLAHLPCDQHFHQPPAVPPLLFQAVHPTVRSSRPSYSVLLMKWLLSGVMQVSHKTPHSPTPIHPFPPIWLSGQAPCLFFDRWVGHALYSPPP